MVFRRTPIPSVTIQGTVINFPNSAQSPNWAEPVIQFAEATAEALAAVVGTYDVSPQVINIDLYNPGTDINLTSIPFPTSAVRAVFMRYALLRSTNTTTAYEAGLLVFIYNPNGNVDQKWEVTRDGVGDGKIMFSVQDNGQVLFSTTAISGSGHTGRLAIAAQALLQEEE